MNFFESPQFHEYLDRLQRLTSQTIDANIKRIIDELFDRILDEVGKTEHVPWARVVPAIMSLPPLPSQTTDISSSIWMEEPTKEELLELEKKLDQSESDVEDAESYFRPVRVVKMECFMADCEKEFPSVHRLKDHLQKDHVPPVFEYRCWVAGCEPFYSCLNM